MELVEQWWNCQWRRLCRDVYLEADRRRWIVHGQIGGYDGREVRYDFECEHQARAMVDRLKATTQDEWKNITKLIRRQQAAALAAADYDDREFGAEKGPSWH